MVWLTEDTRRRRKRSPTRAQASRAAGTRTEKQTVRKKRRRKLADSGTEQIRRRTTNGVPMRRTMRRRPIYWKKLSELMERPIFQAHGLLSDYKGKWDWSLFVITIALLFCGLVSLMSASYPDAYYDASKGTLYYFIRQLIYAVIGIIMMLCTSAYDYHRYHVAGRMLYVISVVALFAVLTPFGTTINQSRRWIMGFQPSELAKLAVILMFASGVSAHPERIRTLRGLLPYAGVYAIIAIFLAAEPHMSAAIIILIIAVAILFVGGMRLWYFIPVGAVGGIIGTIAFLTMTHVQTRVSAWLHPFDFAQTKGFQAVQSLIAIGSGGLFGRGLGQSRQKFLFLPEPMNDFIFSVVCEELGFIGAILILIMFLYFIYRGFLLACRAPDRFGSLIAVGITTQLGFQILMNLCVVSGIFPVTGVSLPFFSFGGTALVMQLFEVGILLNISRHIPPSRREERQLRAAGKRRGLR